VSIRHSSYLHAVTRLGNADLEGALRFVREAHAEPGIDPFPARVLALLRRLVGSEQASFCECDRVHERLWCTFTHEDGRFGSGYGEDEPEELETFWRLVAEHPLCPAMTGGGRFDAMKISDVLTRRQWHRTTIYNDYYRVFLLGMGYEIEVGIKSPLDHSKTFFFQSAHRDFTERDRALLKLLAPHFAQLDRASTARRTAAIGLIELQASDPDALRGILLPDRAGREIDAATDRARRLLETYFPDGSGIRLPAALSGWLEDVRVRENSPQLDCERVRDLKVSGPAGVLSVERALVGEAEVVVLAESVAVRQPVLTAREREVLDLVAEGKRNSEIAQDLWLSPSTVRKHLENIYGKLGVTTRTAAVHAYSQRHDKRASRH
jgi:DNA-binding CsgD family transcriptional regulator